MVEGDVGDRYSVWLVAVALFVPLLSCGFDDSDRCGADQVFDVAKELCLCAPGFRNDGIACVGSLQNAACTGATCADPIYSVCAPTPQGGGYCSRSCTTNADCDTGWICAGSPQPYCKRPPTGAFSPCAAQADCASFDANYCEMSMAKACLVAGCTAAPDNCSGGQSCCDLTSLGAGTLCLPPGTCPVK